MDDILISSIPDNNIFHILVFDILTNYRNNYNNIYIDSTHKSRHKLITEEKDSDPDSYKRDSRKASINNIPRYFYMEEIMKFLGATP